MAANRQSPAVAGYFEKADTFGRLTKVSKRFGRMREITLKKYDGERFWLHISDNSKCFNAGTKSFDISRSTTVSISYEEGIELKNIIGELEGYRSLMNGQTMMGDAQVHPPTHQRPSVQQQPPVQQQSLVQQQPRSYQYSQQ